MPTNYTPQLGLSLPTQGELTGTWGDVTNTSMTSLVDSAIAGTTTLSTDADVTLTATVGAANQARSAVLLCNGARTLLRNITAPATSKPYTVINATTGGFSVVIRGVGPTAGVSVPAGKTYDVVWNGSDFIVVGSPVSSLDGVVAIVNGGTGQTTPVAALSALGAAPIASPTFTGVPAAPTPGSNISTTQVPTTAWVNTWYAPIASPTFTGVPAVPTPGSNINTTQVVNGAWVNTWYAPLANPALTGVPTAPTAAPGNNTTQIATTAFGFANFAPLASPAFTGVPTAPTAAYGTNSTQLATMAALAAAVAVLPSGSLPDTTGKAGQFLSNNGAGGILWNFVPQDIANFASGII